MAVINVMQFYSSIALATFALLLLAPAATGQDLLGMLKGAALVTNANSLFKTGRAYRKAACAVLCGKLPGCNGWSYCDSKTGCGAGCSAYAKANGKLPKDTASGYGTAYLGLTLPVKKIGYWTYPKEGGSGCKGDKWAYGTCTLFKVADPKRPILAVKASGWLSRTILPVPGCTKGLPWTCLNCNSAPNKAQCLACANANPIPKKQPLSGPLAYTNTAQGACLKCGQLPKGKAANQCFDCVIKYRPCATCAYTAPGAPAADVAACVSCSYADIPPVEGPNEVTLTGICNDCTRRTGMARAACLKCVTDRTGIRPVCLGGRRFEGPTCEWPSTVIDTCNLCTKNSKCLACFAKKGGECLKCSTTGEATDDCLQCLMDSRKGCLACVQTYPEYLSQNCVSCYNDLAVKDLDVCLFCESDEADTLTDRRKCRACIRDPATTDVESCKSLQ